MDRVCWIGLVFGVMVTRVHKIFGAASDIEMRLPVVPAGEEDGYQQRAQGQQERDTSAPGAAWEEL